MRSVRLNAELERRLTEAAKLSGQPVSEIIREAIREKCDRLLAGRLDLILADVIGSVNSGGRMGDESRHTGRAFTRLVVEKHKQRTKRRARA